MGYKLQDLIDIDHFQNLQDRLNKIYSSPSSIIDNDGNILTATGWQEICTQFHRKNKAAERICIKSDQYIKDHIHEANPDLSYRCPHGLVDNATPIIIDGVHYGNFFTGQFFFEEPDLAFFSSQAQKYGFDEDAYLAAVKKVPIWSQEQLNSYLFFIKGLIEVIAESGLKKLREIEQRKQIQKNEQRNRIILKTAMDGFWVIDTDGRLLEVNDAYCSMSGYSEDELLTLHISDLDVFETRESVSGHIQNIISSGSDRFQSKHRRKDGTLFDVEVSVQLRPELNGLGICFLRDITDQKRAEFEHENTVKMLETLNAQTDLRKMMHALLQFMQEICSCEAAGIRLRKGDDFPYYEVKGFSINFVATETQLCVEDLNGQLMRDDIGNPVLECMCGNVICGRFDPSKPFFTEFGSFVTDSTSRLLAGTSEQDRQAPTRNRCNGEGYESVLLIPLRTGGKTFGLLQFNDRKQGCFSSQMVARLEKIAGSVALTLAHREAEEDREKLQDQLSQAQKSESLGRMAGAIAHHFNNQLSVVMGNLEIALKDVPLDAGYRKNLLHAMMAGHKAAAVSRQMLIYLGHALGRNMPADLSDSCRKTLSSITSANPEGMNLVIDFPVSGPTINADPIQIQEVLANLITNAWESISNNQGSIGLTIRTVDQVPTTKHFPIDWKPQNVPYACLEVSDTGCGIKSMDIEKLFDPFFTTQFIGRGMGLPVVMGIVKAHRGCITVDSEPGRGSTFRIYIPISTEEITLPLDQEKPTRVPTRKVENGGTVLLIEDEEMVRNMAKAMLIRLGYAVIEAQDGVEAVKLFQEHQNEIDCVLSDLTMPRMNGWETLTALRKKGAGVPVILASGYDKDTVMAGDHPELPQAFLNKPYSMTALKDVLMEVIRL